MFREPATSRDGRGEHNSFVERFAPQKSCAAKFVGGYFSKKH